MVQVHQMTFVQFGTLASDLGHGPAQRVRYQADEIAIVGSSSDSVSVHDREPTEAVQLDGFANHLVEVVKERHPRFRWDLTWPHTATALE
jgi:hypothetical protein